MTTTLPIFKATVLHALQFSFFCLQIPVGSRRLILQQVPSVKLNHCKFYRSMALPTRFSAGGFGHKGIVLFTMRLHGQPSKPVCCTPRSWDRAPQLC